MKNKNILVVSYSQSGQLDLITKSVLSTCKENVNVYHKYIVPKKEYPYPWDLMTFMDTFPESIYLDPCEIEEIPDDEIEYDLVILAYQVWFLSPSIPTTAFLKSSFAKEKLKNKPVITLIGCRNMWIKAQEKVESMLTSMGAKIIDNIVLIDQGNSLATFITTPRWLLTGKKDALWNIFPKAGVSQSEIESASRFGRAIQQGLDNDNEQSFKSLCYGLGAVNVNEKLIKSEQIATRSFEIWGKLIRKLGKPGDFKRKPVVMLYLVFLLLIIMTVVPINMLIQIINRKINKKSVELQKEHFEMPSGSSTERMKEFS
ncbi:dialkylresorcinol condensing enzyme [Arcobacteraceae bacterium]|nr:dialkylresorcinol condensing enzyme [Arcobacteraceae bacterium]